MKFVHLYFNNLYVVFPYLLFVLISIIAVFYREKYLKTKNIKRSLMDCFFEILLGIINGLLPFITTCFYSEYLKEAKFYNWFVSIFMDSLSLFIFAGAHILAGSIVIVIVTIVKSFKVLWIYIIFLIIDFFVMILV